MKETEVIVEVTEFDNLRNEYLQQEAAGNDYISMLKAQMTSEYEALLAEDKAEAELYYVEARELISRLVAWRDSGQHVRDREFRDGIGALVEEECHRQSFSLREDDAAWVYLAGEHDACLHLGNDSDSVRLVYTRDGIADCIREAVSMLRTRREKREKEILDTLRSMQEALVSARGNTSELESGRVGKVFYSSMVGVHPEFVSDMIARFSSARSRRSKKITFSAETDARYHEFMGLLAEISTPLVMAGSGRTPLFRFVMTIPQEGEIRVSWDSYNCKNYLYGETFDVRDEFREKMRLWWSQSCMMELKRLKELETVFRKG